MFIALLGSAGSGKGTQIEFLVKRLGAESFVMGNVLRAEIKNMVDTEKRLIEANDKYNAIKASHQKLFDEYESIKKKVLFDKGPSKNDDSADYDEAYKELAKDLDQLKDKIGSCIESMEDAEKTLEGIENHYAKVKERGEHIKSRLEKGELVSDEITSELLANKINVSDKLIIDGFPRSISQAEILDKLLVDKKLDYVVHIDVPKDELLRRLRGRFSCSKCGKIYNKSQSKSDICAVCGSDELEMRDDDQNEAAIKRRLEVFQEQSSVVLEYYKSNGKLASVDGMGSVEDVSKRIFSALNL